MRTTVASDLPNVILFDQRRQPDRRAFWRGGRRNTDWTNRPLGAWRQLERRFSMFHQLMAKLSVH